MSRTKILGTILGILSVCFLSTYTIFAKLLQLHHIPSETIALIGQIFALITILLTFGYLYEYHYLFNLGLKKSIGLIVVALLSAVLAPLLLLKGLEHTTATTGILVGRLEPVFASLIAIIRLKEKRTKERMIGSIIMIIGIIIIIAKGTNNNMSIDGGSIAIAGSALARALSTNIFKKYLGHIHADTVILVRNFIGVIVLMFAVPYFFGISHDFSALLTTQNLILFGGFGVLTIVLGQLLWYKSLTLIPAKLLSSISLLSPFLGVILSVVILNEQLYTYHITGGILIIIGLIGTMYHITQKEQHHLYIKWKKILR